MKIVEVFLRQYGPVPETVLHLDGGIDLIYGPNESGKTLLVDALLKMLLGRKSGLSRYEDRVEENPDGYLRLKIDDIIVKMETKQTLRDSIPEESPFRIIDPREFRNIFIVRDSDLLLKDEKRFYRGFVEKVVGTYSSEIELIADELRTRGRLTSKLQLSNSRDSHFASSYATQARSLASDIRAYLEKTNETGIDRYEGEYLVSKLDKKSLKVRVDRLDMARQAAELKKLRAAMSRVYESQKKLSEFDERETQRLVLEIERLDKDSLEESNLRSNRHVLTRVSVLGLALSVLLFVSFNLMVDNALLGFAAFMGMVIVSSMSLIGTIWMGRKLTTLSKRRFALMERARGIGIQVKDLGRLERDVRLNCEQLEQVRTSLHKSWGVLEAALELRNLSPDEGAAKAEAKITKMEQEVDISVSDEYSPTELKNLRERLDKLDSRVDELHDALEEHNKKLGQLSERFASLDFQSFLDHEIALQLENLDALQRSLPILEELADKIKREGDAARMAIGVFDELMAEETEKLTEIFRKGGPASSIFSSITGGRYGEVFYDMQEDEVVAKRPSGESMPVALLSKGATDQLYLSVRIALAKRLLGDQHGFFILDDAMLSSDGKRLERQVTVLKDMANNGWQIIYFTSKDDTLRAMKKIASPKIHKLAPLP